MIIKTIDAHTMGEPLRAVVEGLPTIVGSTMLEKQEYFSKNFDEYRRGLLLEPHGHGDMFGAILTEKVHDSADIGVLFMNTQGMEPMCGHGSIAMAVIAVKYGYVEMKEPVTTVRLDVPAGIVSVDVEISNGRVMSATLQNVTSYMTDKDIEITLDSKKSVLLDVAYGGNRFALVKAENAGINLETENLKNIIDIGMDIKRNLNRNKTYADVLGTLFYQKSEDANTDYKDVVVFGEGSVDRSPCGTGTSALVSMLRAKGIVKENAEIAVISIFGGRFKVKIYSEKAKKEGVFVIPKIEGNAYVIGESKHYFNDDDPLEYGFYM